MKHPSIIFLIALVVFSLLADLPFIFFPKLTENQIVVNLTNPLALPFVLAIILYMAIITAKIKNE